MESRTQRAITLLDEIREKMGEYPFLFALPSSPLPSSLPPLSSSLQPSSPERPSSSSSSSSPSKAKGKKILPPLSEMKKQCDILEGILLVLLEPSKEGRKEDKITEILLDNFCATLEEGNALFSRLGGPLIAKMLLPFYKNEFLLKRQCDQMMALYPAKSKIHTHPSCLIQDPQGLDFWMKSFEGELMVPWELFFHGITHYFVHLPLQERESQIKSVLDATRNGYVSAYEFGAFLRWFGPFLSAFSCACTAFEKGFMAGFVTSVEAQLSLWEEPAGTFLIRLSKSQNASFAVTYMSRRGGVTHFLLATTVPYGLKLIPGDHVFRDLFHFVDSFKEKLRFPYRILDSDENGQDEKEKEEKKEEEKEENKKEPPPSQNTESECVVCLGEKRNCLFLPCRHMACCSDCAKSLNTCPICRAEITERIDVFFP